LRLSRLQVLVELQREALPQRIFSREEELSRRAAKYYDTRGF
jgi:hypothetical protein